MYLRGIQFSEIESILQFIYLGEATFYEERMEEFLAVAKSLEIKELCNAEHETGDETGDEPGVEPFHVDPVIPTDKVNEQTVLLKKHDQLERRNKVVGLNGIYECESCKKTFSKQSNSTQHIQSKHEQY